jgi:hypothetical protein
MSNAARIALVALLFAGVWALRHRPRPAKVEPQETAFMDQECERILRRPDAIDVRAWISSLRAGEALTLGEQSERFSRAFLEHLYARGAVVLWAADRDSDPSLGQTANTIVAQLPDDPAARARLFELEARMAEGDGFDPSRDSGQRCLVFFKFKGRYSLD